MKNIISLILIFVSALTLHSQSLILNGDFEILQSNRLPDWEDVAGTPDIINLGNLTRDYTWQTNKQYFKGITSRGFVGFAFNSYESEVIGTKLSVPLEKDSIYTVKMKLLTGYSCSSGLEKVTVGLTENELEKSEQLTGYEINMVALTASNNQIEGGRWHELETEYKAKGGERYLSLGNFNKANKKYTKGSQEVLVAGEASNSCNYLIIDAVEIFKYQPKAEEKTPIELPLIVIEDVAFEFGKWEIKSSHFAELNKTFDVLKKSEGTKFIITGYTDNVGSDAANLTLSEKRANAVKAFFVEKGIPEDRIIAIGKGEANPKYSNETAAGRTKNRRVEIEMQ